jgi:hypothetical protein
MTAVFNALNKTPAQLGENNSVEYGWSKNVQEKLLQLSFQIVRTSDKTQKQNLMSQYAQVLNLVFEIDGTHEKEKYEIGSLAYKLLAQTRDIIAGKGEYDLAYYMVAELAKRDKTAEKRLAVEALQLFVLPTEDTQHPYGSWKDIKYFLNFWKESGQSTDHPIVNNCTRLVTEQLKKDMESQIPSLCSRWVPRESSRKFGWQTEMYAKVYFSEWMVTVQPENKKQHNGAKTKCLTHFRQDVIVPLNKKLHTPQIKQCGKEWSKINLEKDVTSVTMRKQRRAFQNVDKKGEIRSQDPDRIECGKNFENLIARAKKGEATIKGKRVGISDLVKDMYGLVNRGRYSSGINSVEMDTLNLQWEDNAKDTPKLKNFIAMVDTSGSMTSQDALYGAMALGLRIAEKSKLGKRIMTFSARPEWVNLESCEHLSDMIAKTLDLNWGMNTNFEAALTLMLDACIANKVPAREVEDFVLVILSDMQIDGAHDSSDESMYKRMASRFATAGQCAVGEPYRLPHILFWNCRQTSGFPALSSTPNASMMSGFSPALLNVFVDKGIEALREYTPWGMFKSGLDNDRYKPMQIAFDKYWERRKFRVVSQNLDEYEIVDSKVEVKEHLDELHKAKKDCDCKNPHEYAPHIKDGPCRHCHGFK